MPQGAWGRAGLLGGLGFPTCDLGAAGVPPSWGLTASWAQPWRTHVVALGAVSYSRGRSSGQPARLKPSSALGQPKLPLPSPLPGPWGVTAHLLRWDWES